MNQFIQKYDEQVTGTLSGWDRVVFRGTLRMLCFVDGMMGYLSRVGVLLKDFGEHAQAMTGRLIEASLVAAEEARRPVEYLQSPKTRKDEYARNIALVDDIQDGDVHQNGDRGVREIGDHLVAKKRPGGGGGIGLSLFLGGRSPSWLGPLFCRLQARFEPIAVPLYFYYVNAVCQAIE